MEYKKGDVVEAYLKGEVDYLAHQCNCFNTMGSGIARQIKEKIPGAAKVDQITRRGDRYKLGTYSKFEGVYNLYGQYYYGREQCHTDYRSLARAFGSMLHDISLEMMSVAYIGIPKMGSGLGGGNWEIIEELLQREIDQSILDARVYVYSL